MKTVRLISVGEAEIPGSELFWMRDFDKWYPLNFQVVYVETGNVKLLINTGPPKSIDALNARWLQAMGPRAEFKRNAERGLVYSLYQLGVTPDEITHVVLTPLQLYSTGGLSLFRNADVYISRRGWIHLLTTHEHPHDDKDTSVTPEDLAQLVTSRWRQLNLLADEDEISDGIRVWWAGAHHRASLVVELTARGRTYAFTDAFFYLRNLEMRHPIGVCENIYESVRVFDRISDADVVLPLYDPSNFARFPGGIVV